MKNEPLSLACPGRTAGHLFAAILLWLVLLHPSHAAVTEAWVARYNNVVSNANARSSKFLCDAAGDLIVTGTANNGVTGGDMLTCKYSSADGAVLWQQRYDGSAGGDDFAQDLALDSQGNVIVAGNSFVGFLDSHGTPRLDYYVAKYASATGALMWGRRFQDPLNSAGVTALRVDANDNVVVCGLSMTARLASADGALLWFKSYPGTTATAVVDAEGNVVVTGASPADGFSSAAHTVKYAAASGAILWERYYPSATSGSAKGTALALDGNGNVFVSANRDIGRWGNWYLAKYAGSDGSIVWEQTGASQATRLVLDSQGEAILSGYTIEGTGGWGIPATGSSFTVKFAGADGAMRWAIPRGLSSNVSFDANDNLISEGSDTYAKYAASNGALLEETTFPFPRGLAYIPDGRGDVFVLDDAFALSRYVRATGTLVWHQQFQGPVNFRDIAQAVAVDGAGNVIATGSSAEDYTSAAWGPTSHIFTAKFAAGTGALLWDTRYHGPAWPGSTPVALAVDRAGDVVMTGSSYATNDGRVTLDFYTAKYASADGALLWERRYDGPLHGYDSPVGVAMDASGNVVVAGSADVNTDRPARYIAKYAAADGALVWETSDPDPSITAYDPLSAFCLDANGDALVIGAAGLTKYAGADGHVLWKRNAPGRVMALDSRGNVLVSGSTTAKYAGVDGALIWEKPYGGSHVSMDPEGNVLLTDFSQDALGNFAKVSGADGSVVWTARASFPWHWIAAADRRGDVFLIGDSTVKYSGTTGALLWEKSNHGLDPASIAFAPGGVMAIAGTSARNMDAWDFMAIVFREIPQVLLERNANGSHLRCFGEPGRVHQVWRSPSVTQRGTLLHQERMPAAGSFQFTDTSGPAAAAFYHLETLP